MPTTSVSYSKFLVIQDQLMVAKLKETHHIDYLLVMEHDKPIYTGGRRSEFSVQERTKLEALGAHVYQTGRGGQITWHGPGQLCLYPILNLVRHKPSMHWYVERLENVLIRTIECAGLKARRGEDRCKEVGVWIDDRKVGFVGIKNSRWITGFGISLNIYNDLSWFDHIVPCGLEGVKVTSLWQKGSTLYMDQVKHLVVEVFRKEFEFT